ncbi:MAG: ABC transporter ATP-binding protein [Gammaproteobacteria bacterium]|nr:ABC transporter ATP-binding protein [Gammaproteobacteria bacterium]
MGAIILDKVSKRFGEVTAVDALDLVIEEGEFVSVLGPSGCGKTTLLRMLAGLEQASDGEISIAGRIVNNVPPAKRDIAMVFQTYALYPHMTVAGNIEYPLKKRRVAKNERKRRVQEAAELLELGELLSRKPRELSGGQQQRVALGRAMVRDPAVFLLDEPLSNLDAKLRAHMRAELIRLHRRIGRTMVYVTHDQLEAMTMSQRIAVIRDGKLQQFASPADIYERPQNDFVAGFIGTPSMNFIDGTIVKEGGANVFRSGDWSLNLDSLALNNVSDTADVRIGIRPEDFVFNAESGGESARVQVVEPTGHESIVFMDFHGHELVARVAADFRLAADDVVMLTPRVEKLHVFSTDNGRRLNDDSK